MMTMRRHLPGRACLIVGIAHFLTGASADTHAQEPARAVTAAQAPSQKEQEAPETIPDSIPRTFTLPPVENAPFPYANPEEVGLSAERLDGVADRIAIWVWMERIVGGELLIVKDRKIVLHEAVGWTDRQNEKPLERNSIYRIRSMTKPFTATSAFLLIEEGKLSLDDRVAEYLPSWDNERSGSITIRQLLNHTGGFIQGGFAAPFQSYENLRAAVDAAGEMGPQNPPGEEYRYSDVDSATLGALVEEISGMPVERFIETRILDPLGLTDTHTGYTPDAPWAPRMNGTYRRLNPEAPWYRYWDPSRNQTMPFFRASGGLYTTVFDYARWLAIWMDGTRFESADGSEEQLLSEEMVKAALTPGEGFGYGLHWAIPTASPLIFGHSGSDGTYAYAIPHLDILVLYFTQSRGNNTGREWNRGVMQALQLGG